MAMINKDIREWLDTFTEDAIIGIDEGGLCLKVEGLEQFYLEVGGLPEPEEDSI